MPSKSPIIRFKEVWFKARKNYDMKHYEKAFKFFLEAEKLLTVIEKTNMLSPESIEKIDDSLRYYLNDLHNRGFTDANASSSRFGGVSRINCGSKQSKSGSAQMPGGLGKASNFANNPQLAKECFEVVRFVANSSLSFKNIAGMEKLKEELKDAILLPLESREYFQELDIEPIKGILLYGPPGCGKTFIMQCASGEFNLPLFIGTPDTLLDMYVGNSEKKVAKMFQCAKQITPSILFIDEIDTLLPKESRGTDVIKRIESIFLQELSGAEGSFKGLFIAATNYPENLSPRLIRPGRIDRIIYVPPPDRKTRAQLFKLYLKGLKFKDFTIKDLVKLTEPENGWYYSSSGIKEICNSVKLHLVKKSREANKKVYTITLKDMEIGFRKVPRSISPEMIKQYEKFADKFNSS